MFIEKIKPHQIDVLKEIGNIGAGNAATALSKILNKRIDMTVPDVRVVSFDEMMEFVGGPDAIISSVFLRIEGDVTGSMFFMLPLEQASRFVKQMIEVGEDFSFHSPPYPELAISALQEVGIILSGSYLSSFSDFTTLKLFPSVPELSIDMAGAVISFGLLEVSQVSDYAILIDTAFSEEDVPACDHVKGHFFLLPDPDSFDTIFKALGVPLDE